MSDFFETVRDVLIIETSKQNISRRTIRQKTGVSENVVNKLRAGVSVPLSSVEKVLNLLGYEIKIEKSVK